MATFKSWYDKNKAALNKKRREQYQKNEAKRLAARAYQADYRDRTRGDRPALPGLTRLQVCEELGVTEWTLNSWRQKGFYPDPGREGARVYFTENQKNLIGLLVDFHANHGTRLSVEQKAKLDTIVAVIQQNWSI